MSSSFRFPVILSAISHELSAKRVALLDGTQRKLLDVSIINNMGWQSSIHLKEGTRKKYQWYLAQ